ncbi:MAG: hypothetical protein AAFN66_07600, partial [Pseudomonadota bacterium]
PSAIKQAFREQLPNGSVWDTGASQCIVSEAGGSIAAANFEPLTYNQRHSLENPDFVVMGDQRVPWQDVVQYDDFVNPHQH